MKIVAKESIEWIETSRLDPTGLLFQYGGEIYRAVYKNAVNKVMHLCESGIVPELIKKGLLIDTRIADFGIEGFGMVLHHKRIPFPSLPEDWTRSILLDAAKSMLTISRWAMTVLQSGSILARLFRPRLFPCNPCTKNSAIGLSIPYICFQKDKAWDEYVDGCLKAVV